MSLRCLRPRSFGLFQQILPKPAFRAARPFISPQQSRKLHAIPPIRGDQDVQYRAEGVPGLFSKDQFDIAWTQYQKFLIDRLNTILANDQYRAEWDIKKLLINTARDPNLAATFNYASMAHNNHFFFTGLASEETPIPSDLEAHLITSFGSIAALRDSMLSTASAMFGPGFVWLVLDDNPSPSHPAMANVGNINTGSDHDQLHFRLVTTYLAGTPYPGAHHRQQGVDMNVQNLQSVEDLNNHTRVQNSAGAFGRHSASARGGMRDIPMETTGTDSGGDPRRFGGADVVPVLCLNTWQHAYLHDYGVAGKRDYLQQLWERIDWDHVRSLCPERQRFDLRGAYS